MRFRSRHRQNPQRRSPRSASFRSGDLVRVLRAELAPWLKAEGFKRLGGQAWVRAQGEEHVIVEVQCQMSGWDNRSGSQFVVEFERSKAPERFTGYGRSRLWRLLDEVSRREVILMNNRVAQTLPPPDMGVVDLLDPSLRQYYLARFAPSGDPGDENDVWFAYYDEDDAAEWARFLAVSIGPALEKFLAQPPSLWGYRGPSVISDSD